MTRTMNGTYSTHTAATIPSRPAPRRTLWRVVFTPKKAKPALKQKETPRNAPR